jgi:exodeoxyribonuclease VII small subunit
MLIMAEKKNEEELSFEDSLVQLEEIVKKLEVGDVPLDDAIEEFNKAMKLAKVCDEKLKNAEENLTKLVKDNGEIVDFQVEE